MNYYIDKYTYESQNVIKTSKYFVYDNVSIFFSKNKNILKNNNNIVVYLLNRLGGFGSALLMHIQNSIFLKYINPNLTIIPHFSENSDLFKYHQEGCANSFFLYFINKKQVNIRNKLIFFVRASEIKEIPFYKYCTPIVSNINNLSFIRYFNKNYELKIGNNIKEYVNNIKKDSSLPLIGIHIRSIYQKKLEYSKYLQTSLNTRLQNLSIKLNEKYENYNMYIATDVESYIPLSKQYFKNVHFLEFISRIENDMTDSMPILNKHTGFKLGSDILYDCLALSLCDEIYVSGSNIPFIVSVLNEKIKMNDY